MKGDVYPGVAHWTATADSDGAAAVDELMSVLAPGTVSTEPDDLARAALDWWPLATKRQLTGHTLPQPAAVVTPRESGDVAALLRWAQNTGTPVVPAGGRSSVVGGATPRGGDVVLDLGGFNEIVALDEESLIVTSGAGVYGSDLEEWLQERGYTLGHYPQSLYLSTVGGWVSTRASGTFSAGYGNIEDLLRGLRAVTPTGEVVTIDANPRASTGPDLRHLFLGGEGTLGVVTEVDLQVHPLPEERRLRAYLLDDVFDGIEVVRALAQHGPLPALVRLYDPAEAEGLLEGASEQRRGALLLLGWDGATDVIDVAQAHAERRLAERGATELGEGVAAHWMDHRFDTAKLEAGIQRAGGILDTIEVSMCWRDVRAVYEAMIVAMRPHTETLLGHFSHVYPTGVSLYVIFTCAAEDDALEPTYLAAWQAATEAAIEAGAALAHHHGIGLMRAGWMAAEHGDALTLLRQLKRTLDPAGVLNPGKLLPPRSA